MQEVIDCPQTAPFNIKIPESDVSFAVGKGKRKRLGDMAIQDLDAAVATVEMSTLHRAFQDPRSYQPTQ